MKKDFKRSNIRKLMIMKNWLLYNIIEEKKFQDASQEA